MRYIVTFFLTGLSFRLSSRPPRSSGHKLATGSRLFEEVAGATDSLFVTVQLTKKPLDCEQGGSIELIAPPSRSQLDQQRRQRKMSAVVN